MRSLVSIKNDLAVINTDLENINDVITNFNAYAAKRLVIKSLEEYFIDESILISQKEALSNEYNHALAFANNNNNNNNNGVNVNLTRGGQHTIGRRSINNYTPYDRVGDTVPAGVVRGGSTNPLLNEHQNTGIGTLGGQTQRHAPIQEQYIPEAPIVKKVVIPNYFKEKTVNVNIKDGKPFLTGLPVMLETVELESKKHPIVSPLWEAGEAVFLAVPLRKMKIPYNADWDKYLNKPFSQIDFDKVEIDSLTIENILYYHVKDLLDNMAELGFGAIVNTNEIIDIKNFMTDPDIPVTGTLLMKNAFDNVILTKDTNSIENKEYITFSLGGMHIFYKSNTIDYSNIIKSFTTQQGNKFILTEESFSDLFNIIKHIGASHGILELYGAIQFKYYVSKEKINLVRL